MNSTSILSVLTVVNLALLAYQVAPSKPGAQGSAAILRGRGLEIVDEQGRLRAQFVVEPANATFQMPDGKTGYPETAIFRMITADGKPRVKLTTSVEGSCLMLLGDSDTTHVILKSDGTKTSLKLRNDEKVEQVIAP